ncbi:MAG: phosphatidate cytidylyltransferase [Candidatus Krumholzibacteriota bacterium]|nr:phosphatidate cytidylyltransferase [Candidatus Krumholzibacteriota bacterium]
MGASPEGGGFWAAFAVRVLAAAVLIPLACIIFLRGGWHFLLLTAALATLLLREYARLARARGGDGLFPEMLPPVLALLAAFAWGGAAGGMIGFTLLALLFLTIEILAGRIEGATGRIGERLLVLFYLGVLPGHWILLRELPAALPSGELSYRAAGFLVIYGAGITWIGDTAAYVVGSFLGRHRLPSRVSPRKSVEGLVGGVAGAVFFAWRVAPYWAPHLMPLAAILLGLILAVGGQLGDLFESLLKREAASKDSGRSIPGHGGWLDRLDSLLFTLPLFYYYLIWVIFPA